MHRFLVILFLLFSFTLAADSDFFKQISNLADIEVKKLEPDSAFSAAYEIFIKQPLDHKDHAQGTFNQRIHLSHRDITQPVVLITEGYAIGNNYTRELSHLLEANEIRVEHRYFGESKPDSMQWQYLNIKQSSADYHRIKELFSQIYSSSWVSTGWSKGGQTAAFYRYHYPEDVQATVAYDAPFNLEREEKRIDRFFSTVGSEECRQRIKEFQCVALKRKTDLLPLLEKYAEEKKLDFSIGKMAALEYMVLEYPFSFWQYHKLNCTDIPDNDDFPEVLFNHLRKIVSVSSYSDKALNSTAMYQFFTELGYYGYIQDGLEPLLSGAYGYSNAIFAPQDAMLNFNETLMPEINDWISNKSKNILCISGQNDPWSAPAIEFKEGTGNLKMVLSQGNHFTFINSFAEMDKSKILKTLHTWLRQK